MSLSDYYRAVKENRWEFPSYKKRCPICGGRNCAEEHGEYSRQAFDENNELIKDLPIKRYICKKKVVTFSLLPYQLVPYSKYSIKLTTKVVDTWNKFGKNIYKTLDSITVGNVCEELYMIGASHIWYFLRLFEMARRKHLLWKKKSLDYPLERFIRYCSQDQYRYGETLSIRYYNGNGGYLNNSQFLFGRASQFRKSRL